MCAAREQSSVARISEREYSCLPGSPWSWQKKNKRTCIHSSYTHLLYTIDFLCRRQFTFSYFGQCGQKILCGSVNLLFSIKYPSCGHLQLSYRPYVPDQKSSGTSSLFQKLLEAHWLMCSFIAVSQKCTCLFWKMNSILQFEEITELEFSAELHVCDVFRGN